MRTFTALHISKIMLQILSNYRKIFRDRSQIFPLAFYYLKKYGARAFIQRIFFTLKSGNIHSAYGGGLNLRSTGLEKLYFANPTVILVTNDLHSPSHDYRIGNFSRSYWENGVSNIVINSAEVMDIFYLPRSTQLVIFWRTSLDLSSIAWINEARSNGVQIAYDNDDLTFDPNVYNTANVNALSLIPNQTADYLVNIITPIPNPNKREGHICPPNPAMNELTLCM